MSGMETALPSTRCVKVIGGWWHDWLILPNMIASPAFTVGKEYEYSDDGQNWEVFKFTGYDFTPPFHYCVDVGSVWVYCREVRPEPVEKPRTSIEVTVKMNGKECKLSDISEETWKKLREV